MLIYDAFIKLCAQVHKTPSAVALELGLEKSTVSRWKRGGGANDVTKQKIADYFGVTVSDLLGETTPNVSKLDTKEKTAAPEGSGQDAEFIRLFGSLSPQQQKTALAMLRALKETE